MKIRLTLLTCILAAVTWAADVTGKWTAQVPGRNGNTREVTMNFKADGEKLTGTMGGPRGDAEISDGKINGDEISFNIVREFQGNQVKLNYTGHVSGDEIHFKVQREGAAEGGREFTAKRAQ
jgi:hypothetical protein